MGTDDAGSNQPLAEPYAVKFLKNRPRLVDKGIRREFLEELEINMRERRKPDTMAERTVQKLFSTVEQAGSGVAKNRASQAMARANEGPLNKL